MRKKALSNRIHVLPDGKEIGRDQAAAWVLWNIGQWMLGEEQARTCLSETEALEPIPVVHWDGLMLPLMLDLRTSQAGDRGAGGAHEIRSGHPPDHQRAQPVVLPTGAGRLGAVHTRDKQGVVGLDIGPSSIAAVAASDAVLEQFCPSVVDHWKDIRRTTSVMKEVITILGVTPDPEFPQYPGAVREWCINTAAVDPISKSILANSEDGKLYRWDLTTNSFTEVITLSSGIGEAYTPTVIGSDGTAYAINDAILDAIGH